MDPQELLRKLNQNMPHQPETDWAGRRNPDRIEIEETLRLGREASAQIGLTNRQRRRLERQGGGNPERR